MTAAGVHQRVFSRDHSRSLFADPIETRKSVEAIVEEGVQPAIQMSEDHDSRYLRWYHVSDVRYQVVQRADVEGMRDWYVLALVWTYLELTFGANWTKLLSELL